MGAALGLGPVVIRPSRLRPALAVTLALAFSVPFQQPVPSGLGAPPRAGG